MVSSRAQNASTAPCRTIAEQEDGSTSARKVSARAASSMMSGLCSAFSRCTWRAKHKRWVAAYGRAGQVCGAQRHSMLTAHQHGDQQLHREDAQRLLARDRQQLVELVERIQLRDLVLVLAQLHQDALRSKTCAVRSACRATAARCNQADDQHLQARAGCAACRDDVLKPGAELPKQAMQRAAKHTAQSAVQPLGSNLPHALIKDCEWRRREHQCTGRNAPAR